MSGCVGRVCGCWSQCRKKKKYKFLEQIGKVAPFEADNQRAFGVVAPDVYQDWVKVIEKK
jgi:hypothetical protein